MDGGASLEPGRRRRRFRRLADEGGNVALIFALLLPGLLVVALGAMELNQVLSDKKRTQDVADSAALMGAGQLGVSPVGADQRAQAYALAQLSDVQRYAAVTASAVISASASGGTSVTNNTMTVSIDTQRASFFGNLLPLGGFHTHVVSAAVGMNSAPLCVLGTAALLTAVHITGNSELQAGSCLVHSNSILTADPLASILASANEATLTAVGPINATPSSLAPSIADPFASLNVNPPTACSGAGTPVNVSGGASQTLAAGVHTGAVTVSGGSTLTLGAGDHYFCNTLNVSGGSTVTGTDVDLVFDNGANFALSGAKTAVSLSGRQSGPLAGFVLVADRTYTGVFTLSSDFITQLTGTVYVPTATLAVNGTAKSGSTTPWTVIVAQNLTVNGGADLVINADYAASSVPVPTGVGNERAGGGAKIVQ